MAKWRYGLVKNEHGAAIHEVFMDKNGRVTGVAEQPVTPEAFDEHGDDLKASVEGQLERMLADIRRFGVEAL